MSSLQGHPEVSQHPLDPLNQDELGLAVAIIRRERQLDDRVMFEQVRLKEPSKKTVRGYRPGDAFDREAFAVVLDRNSGKVFEAVVLLNDGTIKSWTQKPGVQPCILAEEVEEMDALVKRNPDFLECIKRRGISNIDQVSVEGFAVANFSVPEEQHLRMIRAHCFYVESPGDNPHVRPIEGLVPVVDLNAMKVLRVEDSGVVPIPPDRGDYRHERIKKVRKPLAELEISQPNGPDFRVDGHAVSWQNWRFRIGFTPREGLVLHTLSFTHGGRDRPVLYRASLSELVVPYGDTAGDHYMNHSFDLGEGVFGAAVNSLKLGCDCVGEIFYFDANLVDGYGEVKQLPNAICMHEEDYGVLWKHTDSNTESTEVRRSRRLVVSSFFTIGNYDYGIFWYLYLDGTIEFEVKLTGMLYVRAIEAGEETHYGTVVAENLNAMVHEHYFNVRLDMSVDGDENTAIEVEVDRIETSPSNPHGNAHGIKQTVIESERQGGRKINPGDGRYWTVVNRSKRNRLGWHPGYKLVPGPNIRPMHQPGSPFMRRAGFVEHDLWVTAFDPDQLHAPGNYLNQNEFGPGLPEWVEANRNLEDTDIVLWHTVGLMHVPRPEEYPVMPVEYIGFMLKPAGFFERNPTLDLAPPECHLKR